MGTVRIDVLVDGVEPDAALRLVTHYRRWPAASAAVRSVEVTDVGDGVSVSHWEVMFRGGLMRWSERDAIDPHALAHTFTLIEGDPHSFAGSWIAEPRDGGCRLELSGDFDLGMPSLRHVLEPIAIEALEDAIGEVLRALFGEALRMQDEQAVAIAWRSGTGG